jgi:hypothetical protein
MIRFLKFGISILCDYEFYAIVKLCPQAEMKPGKTRTSGLRVYQEYA